MSLLMPREVDALQCALDLTYQGWASCDQVIRRHGAVRPFSRIKVAELRRIHQLRRLFITHGLPIPANPWAGRMPLAESLAGAYAQAVEQERARLRCGRQLLAGVDRVDLRSALSDLVEASEARHLPAFERCGQCRNTAAGGCPDGPSRPASAPPRRCVARTHQDWLWETALS